MGIIIVNNMKILYVTNREEWRKWLSENFESEKEIWFVSLTNHQIGIPKTFDNFIQKIRENKRMI